MTFGLLWIELLVACVLYVAMEVRFALGRNRRWKPVLGCVVAILVPLMPLGLLLATACIVPVSAELRHARIGRTLGLDVLFLAAAALILAAGLRRDAAGIRRAASWPQARIIAALLVVVSLMAMTVWNLDLQAKIEVQALRTEAGVLALRVLPPQVPDALNAAPLYQQAAECSNAAMTPGDKGVDYLDLDAHSPQVTAYLERQQKALDLVRRAADLPACRPETDDLEPDLDARMKALGVFRSQCNLLAVASRAETGSVDVALADCHRIYAIGGHASSSPTLISGLVSLAVDDRASRTVAQVLPFVTNTAQLDHFPLPDPHAVSDLFVRDLRGEEAYGIALFCDVGSGNVAAQHAAGGVVRFAGEAEWFVWVRDDVGQYRQYMQRLRHIAEQPYYQSSAERKQIEEEFRPESGPALLTSMIVPSLVKPLSSMASAQALRSAVAVAVAATRYRLAHHDYPSTADALVPTYLDALPLDPFDGHPLRYTKSPDGTITIYSVGPDLIDNAGDVEPKKDSHNRPPDIGLILTLPPAH